MLITKANGVPKYLRLKEALIAEIKSGKYRENDKFYTEKELMSKYELSYATVTNAIKRMVEEGYFYRKKGLGTFVTQHGLKPFEQDKSVVTETLYINDISRLASKMSTPLSWYSFDQIQKGVINSYNGPVKFVDLSEIIHRDDINAILIHPVGITGESELRCNHIIVNLRSDVVMKYNAVSIDRLSSSFSIMNHLINESGHQKVGFIGGNTIACHSDIYAGYEIGLRTFFIPFREEYVIRGLVGTEQDGYRAAQKLLALPTPPTAIFADTSFKAIGAMAAVQDAGLKIPDDISVISHGYIPDTDTTNPLLTTVKLPFYQMGKHAVEMLQEKTRRNCVNIKSCVMRGELFKRGSVRKLK